MAIETHPEAPQRPSKPHEDKAVSARRKKTLKLISLATLALILLALAVWAIFALHKPVAAAAPKVSVAVGSVTVQDTPLTINALGQAQPWQGVLVRTQVNGVLRRVNFREGGEVKAGAVLAEIDSAPYRAALTQAQGALLRDQALLQAARVDLTRYQTLAAQDSIARQTLDTQAALVKQDEALVKIDQGAVAAAQVNVAYCRIVAPISGRVGVRLVDPGNIVSTADTTGIVIVNQIRPMAVTFSAPQGDFQRLSDVSNGFRQPLNADAISQDSGAVLGSGQMQIADNHVDPTTGEVAFKARFDNAAEKLWPGQFVIVRLTLQTLKGATLAPAAAINQGANGAFVYIVLPNKTVAMRPVTVLATQGGVAILKAGLPAGQTVVTDGQMSLRPGLAVTVRPAAAAPAPPA